METAAQNPPSENSVDPESRAVLDAIAASGRPQIERAGVSKAREAARASHISLGQCPRATLVRDFVAPGPGGAIPIRMYRPLDEPQERALPLFVYFHGGGWMLGNIETGHSICAELAVRLDIAVAAVDYRLAPEHPFPAAIEDCTAALDWLVEQSAKLSVLPDLIAIGGDSAGGNLAAVCALRARDGAGPALRAQILIYPATDLTMTSESYKRNAAGYSLTAAAMAWYVNAYLAGTDATNWRASPLHADTVDGVAPAFIVTCGFDPLCDEGAAYASRLCAAGVPTRYLSYPRQVHGFALWGRVVRDAERLLAQIEDELRCRLW